MSHFSVGVFVKFEKGKDIEELVTPLLAPYKAGGIGEVDTQYLQFHEATKEEINDYQNYKEEYSNLGDFLWYYYGYKLSNGKYGLWYNPNAKWEDYWEVAGRFSDSLIDKEGLECDFELVKNIDWKAIEEDRRAEAEENWNSAPENSVVRYFYGIEKGDTKESYIKRNSIFSTYSVITEDGKWYSKEDDTWEEEYYDRFIKDRDGELLFVIVDCHF